MTLDWAEKFGHFAVVKLLSYYNSEHNVPNCQGVTTSNFAKKNGYIEIANYLESLRKQSSVNLMEIFR